MTDRDVLKRASEALRETSAPSPEDLLKLRQRVLGGGKVLPLAQTRKSKAVRWVLPLAAAFVAGSALAATPGAWEGMLRSVERFLDVQLLAPSHEYAPAARGNKRARPQAKNAATDATATSASAVVPKPAEAAAPEAPAAIEDATRTVIAAAPSHARKPRPQVAEPKAEPTPEPSAAPAEDVASTAGATREPSRDLTLYNKAHELHFRARRYDEALQAWEVYLALTPTPTFALEARYNRAFCLLRLGHFEEARAALKPFAEGRVLGGYRREEATHLIQALDKRR